MVHSSKVFTSRRSCEQNSDLSQLPGKELAALKDMVSS